MKIVIDARILPTGTGRYVERLLHYLQAIDSDNQYVVLLDKAGYNAWEPYAKNFTKLLADFSIFGFDGQYRFARFIQKLNPDLVHFTFQQTALPYRGKKIVSILDLTQLRYKNVRHGNKLVYSAKQRALALSMKRSAKAAKHVLTISEFVKKDIVEAFSVEESKVTVTYCAAEQPSSTVMPKPVKNLQGQTFIAYVGNAIPHKNIPRLIAAFQIIQRTNPGLKLVLAGKNDENYAMLEQQFKKEKLEHIIFTGFLAENELYWLYKNARVFVVPSLSEGFGMPGLEAMAHGAAVASSNATCLPEIYGNAAHYFNPTDTEDMSQKINEVLQSEALRKKLIENGSKQIKKYSWGKMAKETLAVYKKVLANK